MAGLGSNQGEETLVSRIIRRFEDLSIDIGSKMSAFPGSEQIDSIALFFSSSHSDMTKAAAASNA